MGSNKRILANIQNLLVESPEAYYWAGFLMADGSIDFNTQRLSLSLASKDKEHLEKFASFIDFKGKFGSNNNAFRVAVQDKINVPLLAEKFNFLERKTSNPPVKLIENFDNLINFTIGFIDGDGCINKQSGREDAIIRIKIHSTWLKWITEIHKIICSHLSIVCKEPKINSQGYTQLNWSNRIIVNFLKEKSKHLPALERKWSRIDENRKIKRKKKECA